MNDWLIKVRDALAAVESCIGDIESDLEGLDAMASQISPRPAVAVINDLAALCKELRDAADIDGRPLSEAVNDLITTKEDNHEQAN